MDFSDFFFLSIAHGNQESPPAYPEGSSQGILRAASASMGTRTYSAHHEVCPQCEDPGKHSTDPVNQPHSDLKSGYLAQRGLISENEIPEFCSPTAQPCLPRRDKGSPKKPWVSSPGSPGRELQPRCVCSHLQQSDPSLEMCKEGNTEAKEPTTVNAATT